MLIWIKATSAAIGVLVIFLLLLGAASSEQVFTNFTSEEDTNSTLFSTETAEPESIRISELPFSNKLLYPCSANRQLPILVRFEESLMREINRSMSVHATSYHRDAQGVLAQDTMPGCSSLDVRNLPDTPSLEELQSSNTSDAFNKMYYSLLIHSAYAYFINHQLITSAGRCSRDSSNNLIDKSRDLGNKQRNLACIIRMGLTLTGSNLVNTTELINEEITDLYDCSKRQMRDCQVMRSTVHLLNAIATLMDSP